MRIPVKTSRWALWARRLGGFAIPLAIIPVFMHRAAAIPSDTFLLLIAVAAAFAGLAVFGALIAIFRLWRTGDEGWGHAITGCALGLLCLAPIAYFAIDYQRYPPIIDISTNPVRPLSLVEAPDRDDAARAEVLAAFPNTVSRDYRLTANETFRLVEDLVADKGWAVVRRQPPQLEIAEGQINAIDVSLLGWRDEVAIRISGDFLDAEVEMRSAALADMPDFGRNGKRVEDFLLELDAIVIEAERNRPAPDAPPVPLDRD